MGIPCYENLPSGIINVPLPYGMRLKVSPKERHTFKQLRGFKYVEKFIDGTFLASGFLEKKKDVGASNGSWRNASLVNQEKKILSL
jgi:hypothetical protein